MRARHETCHQVTKSLTQSPQLEQRRTSKSPGNSHNLFLFLHHKKRPEYWKKVMGHFLSQEQTESKQVHGGFTQVGLPLEAGVASMRNRKAQSSYLLRGPQVDTTRLKLISRGQSYGVYFSVLKAPTQNFWLILHLLAAGLLALRVFEPNHFEPYSPPPGGSVSVP